MRTHHNFKYAGEGVQPALLEFQHVAYRGNVPARVSAPFCHPSPSLVCQNLSSGISTETHTQKHITQSTAVGYSLCNVVGHGSKWSVNGSSLQQSAIQSNNKVPSRLSQRKNCENCSKKIQNTSDPDYFAGSGATYHSKSISKLISFRSQPSYRYVYRWLLPFKGISLICSTQVSRVTPRCLGCQAIKVVLRTALVTKLPVDR